MHDIEHRCNIKEQDPKFQILIRVAPNFMQSPIVRPISNPFFR